VLVIRSSHGASFAVLLLSKEEVTQGCPLTMVAFGLAVLPLIRCLKQAVLHVHQAWYAAAATTSFPFLHMSMVRLVELGPAFGYYPEPLKSILVVKEVNKAAATEYFADLGFTVVTGHRYLGGFLGANEDLQAWLKDKASTWEHAVGELAGIAPKYPQTAYTGLQKSLQNEWQFVQCVKPGIGDHFHGVEVALATKFLPALFGESIDDDGDPRRILASLPVKHAGLTIPNPTDSASSCYEASTLVCSHLTAAVHGVAPFCHATHQEGR
jgi:hypothetical protein